MNLAGQKVKHRIWGAGVVTSQTETTIEIEFSIGVKKLQYPEAYKCCICGASPAKDPSVELHVDHIVPWSKGGETTIENLQTLCSRCNLGKSDSI